MISRSVKTGISAAVIVVGLLVSFGLTNLAKETRPPLPPGVGDQDLALEGRKLKGFAFGAEGLLADWYWMNGLQYMGDKIGSVGLENLNLDDFRPLNPRLLYPYLNNATDLDPKFMAPFSYGATILPAIDPNHAIALTEKGIANNPNAWRLSQHLGYIYWKIGDYEKSSEAYLQGSLVPGAPGFMKMMAGRMKTEGGSRDLAREIYRQIRDESEDETSKQNAELRLMQIDSLDERDWINEALTEYKNTQQRCPARMGEILPILQRKLSSNKKLRIDASNNIVDPSGVAYDIVPKTCTADLGGKSKVPRV